MPPTAQYTRGGDGRYQKRKKRDNRSCLALAAGEGFEPSHTESESAVLPFAERRCYYSKLQRNVNRKIEKNKKLWAGVSGPRERGQWRLGSPVLSWGCSCFLLWECLQSWGAGFWFLDFFCSLCWFCMVLTSLSPSLACPGASEFIQKLSDFRDTNGGQSMV